MEADEVDEGTESSSRNAPSVVSKKRPVDGGSRRLISVGKTLMSVVMLRSGVAGRGEPKNRAVSARATVERAVSGRAVFVMEKKRGSIDQWAIRRSRGCKRGGGGGRSMDRKD